MHNAETMPELPDSSVHCCVTSPPYFGLRDYGRTGQIGLEETPAAYVDRLVRVFREVRRVLRSDGTLWLNIGDSFASAPKGSYAGQDKSGLTSFKSQLHASIQFDKRAAGLKNKDLIGIPWMLAFALRADGWYLRCDIVWSKPNPMPESVTDRPTRAHEYVFLLSKARRYYYDADAIREPLAESSMARLSQSMIDQQIGSSRANGGAKSNGNMKPTASRKTAARGATADGGGRARTKPRPTTPANVDANEGFDDRWAWAERELKGANKRSVWTVATTPYAGDHFAVMPRELAATCILAGCPAGGIVLDPFMGSGTVAEVSLGNGRHFVGYELNPDYGKLIRERLGLFGGGVA